MLGILRRVAGRRHARLNERVRAADRLADDGYWEEARTVFRQALSREPENTAALRRLADLAQLDGRADEAKALWHGLADLQPERPDACLQIARLSLRRGASQEALAFAERAVHLAPPGRPHEIGHRARSLRDHLIRGEKDLGARHVAIGGMSFCGSTLLGFLLGGLPGVANLGESHALIYRRKGDRAHSADLEEAATETMVRCTSCRDAPCPVWTLGFRRNLADDPLDWYGKLAAQVGAPIVISSDKSHAKLSGLDPFGRHDLIVLFKSPGVAWTSARMRPHLSSDPAVYFARWEREYARLLGDLPVRGRRIVLSFDAFRRAPEAHLTRLTELLDLPRSADAELASVHSGQHVIGGNQWTRRDMRVHGEELAIRADDQRELHEDEARQVANYEARSPVFAKLRNGHAKDFSDLGPTPDAGAN
ncbi:MAG: hypothetical protein JRH16_15370 [Deltaproteobacteria bacterium]|nr:hypothetical protein [Deltaproteobacteria bacterium]MBW2362072.1 hypothetical protein [Deltaproteobacteria bacterium]